MDFLRCFILIASLSVCHSHQLNRGTQMVRNLTDILLHPNTRYVEPLIKMQRIFVTSVKISMSLRNLIDFDVSSGTIQLFAIFTWSWRDRSLEWNWNEYPINVLRVPKTKMWVPSMYIQNTAASIQPIGEAESVRVYPTGVCVYTTPQIFDALCSPDVSKFPFDSHVCSINFARLLEETSYYLEMEKNVSQSDMWENSVWNLTFINVTNRNGAFIDVYLKIERYAFFQMLNLVAPVLILSIMNPFVFILPQESGERMSFSITILLSFVVFMTFTSESLPESRDTICVFNLYLLAELVESALITLSIILLSVLYHMPEDKHIPRPFHLLFCKGRKDRVYPNTDDAKEEDVNDEEENIDKKQEKSLKIDDEDECKLTWSKIESRMNNLFFIFFTIISITTKLVTFGIIAT